MQVSSTIKRNPFKTGLISLALKINSKRQYCLFAIRIYDCKFNEANSSNLGILRPLGLVRLMFELLGLEHLTYPTGRTKSIFLSFS